MAYTFSKEVPCPREFTCRRCGDHVLVDQEIDRRTVFCSPYCEREYRAPKTGLLKS